MIRKMLFTTLIGAGLAISASAAEVFVRIAPPLPLVERRIAPPGRGYIWAAGYHRWDGGAYAWSPGVWVLPPRPHAHWAPAHWAQRRGGWVFVEGHWR